ncbi:hypothetical protein N7492_003513 [Penicillium capsulatum]|uniref:Sld7 C-terminal domain-containing protein n=1 Tax=Penicillium capsulatum TaxID=69766 RepID=A0A9W9ILG4_9EURO|nr:hypothetical protein N7492_003513 [Penicillium capsulatum]KAJ6121903.1 hypothetical protein N7512_004368 [Penicillium capsulatum]
MNVWSGSIALDPDRRLEGIRLIDPTSHWQCDLSKDTTLGVRSFVNPALIPLHARAGPNLELHASHPGTSQWLQGKLAGAIWLNEEELDLHQSFQCPVSLLVSVDGTAPKKSGPVTSDLLIYGILSNSVSCARPPTPPRSSPSNTNGSTNVSPRKPYELRIYAAPLSTSFLVQAQAFPSPPSSSDGKHEFTPAEFLPDISSPSPKRKRVATLFEVAAQHHRRVRQRGGEAVSQLMAPSRPLSSSQNLQSIRIKREPDDEPPSFPPLDRLAAHRSRSVSIGANLQRPSSGRGQRVASGLNADPQKPGSASNVPSDSHSRRGSHQASHPSGLSASVEEKSSSTPNSPPKNTESIIAENKNVIVRTILTCMRLYGFHRSNIKSSAGRAMSRGPVDPDPETSSATPMPEGFRTETPAPAIPADDDDFKAMYHMTYKAASFALRKYLKEAKESAAGPGSAPAILEKGKAMTCIDELLRIFCEDH